jgi:hypothetical protein
MSVRHLNQNQLAERWNISPRTLEGWRSRGDGVVFLKIGGRVAYRLEDIERYETQQLRANTAIVQDVTFPSDAPVRREFREALSGLQGPHEHPDRSPGEQNGNFGAASGVGRIRRRIRTRR